MPAGTDICCTRRDSLYNRLGSKRISLFDAPHQCLLPAPPSRVKVAPLVLPATFENAEVGPVELVSLQVSTASAVNRL
ncbi:hypothetical protein D3C73_1274470 [compost metagenome]